MESANLTTIAEVLGALVGLILIIAQLRIFSIDSKLQKILKIMEEREKNKVA